MLRKIRFYSGIAGIYIFTIGTIGSIFYSSHLFGTPAWASRPPVSVVHRPTVTAPQIISGIPIRITIDTAKINLPIDKGTYDTQTGAWTLSPDHAQYAVMTQLANNHNGTTFIYGHGTDAVFGKIGANPPSLGIVAKIYTDNGRVFSYALTSVDDHTPNDTDLFKDTAIGPPRLIVQTCTGVFSQWRTMFTFSYQGVE